MINQVFPSEFEWNLRGSQGRDILSGRFNKSWRDTNGVDLIMGEIHIMSLWPDRASAEYSFFDPPKDTAVTLFQVVITVHLIYDLILELKDWLESSTDVHVNLCSQLVGQTFFIGLTQTKIPNKLKKVSCQIEYISGNLEGKSTFEVDQSCIRLFVEELSSSLSTRGFIPQ